MGSCISAKKSSLACKSAKKVGEKEEQSRIQDPVKIYEQNIVDEKSQSHDKIVNNAASNIIGIECLSTLAQKIVPYSTPGGYPQDVNFQGGYPTDQNTQAGYPHDVNLQGGYPTDQNTQAGFPGGFAKTGIQGQPEIKQNIESNIIEWFRAVNTDRSGHITAEELQTALANGDWSNFNQEACRMMISMYGKNGTGCIDVNEFQQLFRAINQWKIVFQNYNRDRSGAIEEAGLTQALQEIGYTFSPTFLQKLLAKYMNPSKRLTLQSFIVICVEITRLTGCFRSRDHSMQGNANLKYEEFLGVAMGVYQ